MQVTEVTSATTQPTALSQITHEQLQHEFNFLRAEHLRHLYRQYFDY